MKVHRHTYTLALAFLSILALLPAWSAEKPDRPIGPAVEKLKLFIRNGMRNTGVPGVAVAVVYRDKVVYLDGFGIRKAGNCAEIDADTVFQLASLSKPLTSTVVAALVGNGEVDWDDRIIDIDKGFELSDPAVNAQLTIRDLLSHRSGLPTSAGDALEDLGFTRPVILQKMRLLPITGRFRKSYQYSNFGYTEGAIAASNKVGERWEDLARKRLFEPVGMSSTSYRYSDYENAPNKAAIHIIEDGRPIARYHRDPDAEAPAGSASSSVRDLAQWVRLQLRNGRVDGQWIVSPKALIETHSPQIQRGVDQNGQPSYYGLGWNVDHDPAGNLILSHSGAFFLGTGTTVKLSPSQQLGIVVLTNALPTGLAEATANTFFDLYNYGAPTQDWLKIFSEHFKHDIEEGNDSTTDYSKLPPPSSPAPGRSLSAYVGTYGNSYYGQIEISEHRGSLWMRFPDTGALYTLTHWDGDTFTYRFEAEQAIGTRGVVFTTNGVPRVLIENLALEGNGVFIKESR
jgi:CubicO group peptidase (beta-lactamase class C family)